MAIHQKFHHGTEPLDVAYRKRLWAYLQLSSSFTLDPSAANSAQSLDYYFFKSEKFDEFQQGVIENWMSNYAGYSYGLLYREPAPKSLLYWMPKENRRFYSWALIYCQKTFNRVIPLAYNDYVENKHKLTLLLDDIAGTQQIKKNYESDLKKAWNKVNEINKSLPVLGEQDEGFMCYLWEKTKESLENDESFKLMNAFDPSLSTPVSEEDCYYSSMLIYDLSNLGTDAKKDIIRRIKKNWSNNHRPNKQVNVSLSPSAAESLDALSKTSGVSKSELVEGWIRRATEGKGQDDL